ncbi:hypothetical protein I547_0025 [Mycobacterium kansasii 824]|nr:hypothetical protein I547_0025 [Mycobacterium kansasii 824]
MASTRRAPLRGACDRRWIDWRRPAAPRFAGLAIAAGLIGVDPPRPASRACDRRWIDWRRPAAPRFAGLAIAAGLIGVDPPRPASRGLRSPLD